MIKPHQIRRIFDSSLVGDVTFEVDVTIRPQHYRWLLEGLRKGFYMGGYGPMREIYEILVEMAGVHGMWVRRGERWGWQIVRIGDLPPALLKEFADHEKADRVAAELEGKKRVLTCPRGWRDNSLYGYTSVMQNRPRLRELVAKHIDEEYRKKVEPVIKRVENGKLILRRTDGKWSIK